MQSVKLLYMLSLAYMVTSHVTYACQDSTACILPNGNVIISHMTIEKEFKRISGTNTAYHICAHPDKRHRPSQRSIEAKIAEILKKLPHRNDAVTAIIITFTPDSSGNCRVQTKSIPFTAPADIA